jgi:hypothetical protein
MTKEQIDSSFDLDTADAARHGGALRGFARMLEDGAAYVDAQFGHPPAKLIVGGLVVWAVCVAYMLDDATTLRDLGRLLVAAAL